MIDGEDMYMRLLAINTFKKVPLERVLSFENAPVPLSLFSNNGTITSTKKSDFLEKLESLVPDDSLSFEASNMVDCFVFDAMAVVQMLTPNNGPKTTFQMMASSFWRYILSNRQGAPHVHAVANTSVLLGLLLFS